jgi:pimeloyl-ACP methyl ester carboxylesterase
VPANDILTPQEASHIATNAYFALENWINKKPVAGVETRATLQNRVLGSGNKGSNQPEGGGANPTLRGTGLGTAKLGAIHSATTGIGTSSGFGYTLNYRYQGRSHCIIAMRGTRPELAGGPDLLTDFRGSMIPFSGCGLVHKGFKRTFDSVLPSLVRESNNITKADIVHCVGHSLGGAVATLIAAHYASTGKTVRLYTFGSPRVGAMGSHIALERCIGKENIYRVAHDLDPVSLIGPFPYIHVNGAAADPNNMTLPSPTGTLFGMTNHDMSLYIDSVGGRDISWETVRGFSTRVSHEDSVLARWLLHSDNNPGWVQYASAKTLTILFRLFRYVLRTISTSLILGLTALDLLAEILIKGLYLAKELGGQILTLLGYAATWAGIKVASGAQFSAEIIRLILGKMLATMRQLASLSLACADRGLVPLPLLIGSAWLLSSYSPL